MLQNGQKEQERLKEVTSACCMYMNNAKVISISTIGIEDTVIWKRFEKKENYGCIKF